MNKTQKFVYFGLGGCTASGFEQIGRCQFGPTDGQIGRRANLLQFNMGSLRTALSHQNPKFQQFKNTQFHFEREKRWFTCNCGGIFCLGRLWRTGNARNRPTGLVRPFRREKNQLKVICIWNILRFGARRRRWRSNTVSPPPSLLTFWIRSEIGIRQRRTRSCPTNDDRTSSLVEINGIRR